MHSDLSIERQIAQYLLQIKAVVLKPNNPFTWASGWKSPIYCDNRLILSYPMIRTAVANAFAEKIKNYYPECEAISGVATGGIAQAALVADILNLPMSYVRSGQKGHGRQNQVEGVIKEKQKTVVIEDLISTGGSSLKAVEALRQKGVEVQGLLAVFTYGFQKSLDAFNNAEVNFDCLSNYHTLVKEAIDGDYIPKEQLSKLEEWRKAPDKWTA